MWVCFLCTNIIKAIGMAGYATDYKQYSLHFIHSYIEQ